VNSIVSKDMQSLIQNFKYTENLKNKTILVTGATGLIAKYFTYFLLELNKYYNTNIKVIALVRNLEKAKKSFSSYQNNNNLYFLHQDVCEPITISEDIDFILHAAGSASATSIKSNPTGIIKANTLGTINVLELAKEKKVKKVLFTSTREIYGKVDEIEKITETDMGVVNPLDSRACYPESKRMAEAILQSYYTQYQVPFNSLRIAHTYGPTMEINNDGRVMADFVGAIVNNQDIVLNSDGTAIRSFCYITDTINGIMDILVRGDNAKAYNLANETEPYKIKDIAKMLTTLFPEKNLKVKFSNPSDEVKKGYLNYKITKLDTSALESLGWKPNVKLSEGLKRTVISIEEELGIDNKKRLKR